MIHAFRDDPNVNHAFIIDHALRGGSADETEQAAEIAKSFGYKVRTDRWAHDGISSGIQAKARDYRYGALGRLCRAAGLTRLMTAHTADDQAETLLMRLDRQSGWRGMAGMPEQVYAPLWPALAGVTLHRPWLNKSRAELREYNRKNGLSFIDDPSNENRDFARIRARQALAADPRLRADLLSQQRKTRQRLMHERQLYGAWLVAHAVIDSHGFIVTDAVPPLDLLLHILNVASGRGGPIDSTKLARLSRDMMSADFRATTLGGAWVVRQSQGTLNSKGQNFMFLRDRVAVTGRSNVQPLKILRLKMGAVLLWDGRFFCRAKVTGLRVEMGFGNLQKLRQYAEFKSLFDLPKSVRESLPIFFLGEKPVGFGACDTEYIHSIAASASRLQDRYVGKDNVSN